MRRRSRRFDFSETDLNAILSLLAGIVVFSAIGGLAGTMLYGYAASVGFAPNGDKYWETFIGCVVIVNLIGLPAHRR